MSSEHMGPFRIVRPLGGGASGEVFLVETPWPEYPLAALKRLRGIFVDFPEVVDRFRREAEISALADHPNIVRQLGAGELDGRSFVVSEVVLGTDAREIARRLRTRNRGAPAAVAIKILREVLEALAHLHELRDAHGEPLDVVHRDVSPGNVLVGWDGRARLIDFGLARSLVQSSSITSHGEIFGTPGYVAPEVILGDASSPASDIYGAGAIAYRLLTGTPPHSGSGSEAFVAAVQQAPVPLALVRPDLEPWIVGAVMRLLDPDPAMRPSDARMVARAIAADAERTGLAIGDGELAKWLDGMFGVEKLKSLAEHAYLCRPAADKEQTAIAEATSAVPEEGTVLERAHDEPTPDSSPARESNIRSPSRTQSMSAAEHRDLERQDRRTSPPSDEHASTASEDDGLRRLSSASEDHAPAASERDSLRRVSSASEDHASASSSAGSGRAFRRVSIARAFLVSATRRDGLRLATLDVRPPTPAASPAAPATISPADPATISASDPATISPADPATISPAHALAHAHAHAASSTRAPSGSLPAYAPGDALARTALAPLDAFAASPDRAASDAPAPHKAHASRAQRAIAARPDSSQSAPRSPIAPRAPVDELQRRRRPTELLPPPAVPPRRAQSRAYLSIAMLFAIAIITGITIGLGVAFVRI